MVDAMILLHESTDTTFTTNGFGNLPDAVSCIVLEERNGTYELEMTYPITGKRYEELLLRRIITAKPNPDSDPQPFRIYAITKPINGIVTVNAEHVSYDLSGYPVEPFTAINVADAFAKIKNAESIHCPFEFFTDKTTAADMNIYKPISIRSLLGGTQGSILDIYGGEYLFDKFSVRLLNNRGANRGVCIRYGKNLTDLQQEENCASVYTGVYPFWYSEQDGLIQLPEKIVNAEGDYNFTRIFPLDLSFECQEKPSEELLREVASSYMKLNHVGVPKVSLTVSFAQLAQSEEYKDFALFEIVHLCDTVNVEFPALKVSATAKCISTSYNVLTGKYEKIELGEAKSNLAATISNQNQALTDVPTKSFLEQSIENATQLICGGLGGYVVIHSSTGGKHPDEILIMDTSDITTAKKVWRWNKAGLGYSSKGYNGPYGLAMTQDGEFVADFITVGTLTANLIKAGVLSSLNGKTTINMDTGSVVMNGGLDCDSLVVRGAAVNGSMVMMLKAIQMPDGTYLPQMSFFGADKKQAGAITIGADYTIMSLGRDGTGGDLSMSTSADGSSHMSFRENRSDGMPGNGISIGVNRLGIPELQLRGNGSMKRYLELEWEYDSTRAKYILTGSVGAT